MNTDDRIRLDRMEKKVDDIKDNHLPHIYEVLGKLTGKLTVIIPLIIMILALIGGLYVVIFMA